MIAHYRHIFGPVPSRRFGRSLGVDLTPMKTCTLDCVFCQLGRTSHRTTERRNYVPVEPVKEELLRWRAERGRADCVTLSGSGEPTLHTEFGEVLDFASHATSLPTVLLTNGTLLHLPEVRAAAARADIVKISLSAWDEDSFRRVNRPHPDLNFAQHVEGLRAFRAAYRGALWLEVFVIPGINDARDDAERIARIAATFAPDRVHLNTAARPAAEAFVRAATRQRLATLAALFQPKAIVIGEYAWAAVPEARISEARVLDLVRRRPCTLQQLAVAFERHPNEISKYLGRMARTGRITEERIGGEIFFRAAPAQPRKTP